VVDESGVVAADTGVDDAPVRQLEAPNVSILDVPALALEAFLIGNPLAGIVDNALVLRNVRGRKHSPSLDS
jgi:hypothetical protein